MTVLLQDHALRAAQTTPDATAVTLGDERLGYADLDLLSGRLAATLVEMGVEPGDRVGLLAPKSIPAIVAMHATMRAGGAYVPLDTESPPTRLARIVAAAEPRLLLAIPQSAARLDGLAETLDLPPVGSLTADPIPAAAGAPHSAFTRREWDVPVDSPPSVRVDADDPAHLLFTSGSTGEPKGVVITHRNVVAFVDWAVAEFGTRAGDRISCHPPLHFDLSTYDMYATFKAGAELHLVPPALGVDAKGLARFIRERELTQWFSVPSALTYMAKFDAVEQDDFPHLERLLWCGEVLPTPVVHHWMKRLPHVRFANLYGPTEATIASSHYTVPEAPAEDGEPIPIGVACDGEELLVLDESLAPVPVGEIGDLYIAGVGLSPGYWRDEAKTAAAFLPDPRPGGDRIYKTGDLARVDGDGVFHFVGRADSQIKSRGYRIELGEIESALNAVAGIRECAIVGLDTGGFEGTTICAAYVGEDVEPAQLRGAVSKTLPGYMIPARWHALDALPKNQNGKIDRPALRARFAELEAERAARREPA